MLATLLLALIDGDADDADQIDRQAGAVRIAEFMIRFEAAHTKR